MNPCSVLYVAHAADLVRRYELVDPSNLHSWLTGLPHVTPGTVLDIGAGSGRDAAWFASQGHDVVAVEPSTAMRSEGQRLHPEPRIRWVGDQLPDLSETSQLGISFDLVLLSASGSTLRPGTASGPSARSQGWSSPAVCLPSVCGVDPRPPRAACTRCHRTRWNALPETTASPWRKSSTFPISRAGLMSLGPGLRCVCRMMGPAHCRCYAM